MALANDLVNLVRFSDLESILDDHLLALFCVGEFFPSIMECSIKEEVIEKEVQFSFSHLLDSIHSDFFYL